MAEHVIEMRHINKGYMLGDEMLPILRDINFTVDPGEFVAILGPSGSGKTTLMNMIGCMDILDSGEYYLNGRAIHDTPEEELTEVRGMDHRTAAKECKETIRLLGLEERVTHKPNELSGGQKQRVSIARALSAKPAILLADEPTGALDTASGKEVLKLFVQLNEMGNTIVMIIHDLKVAQAAKRVVRIEDGCLTEMEG